MAVLRNATVLMPEHFYHSAAAVPDGGFDAILSPADCAAAIREISAWSGYAATPLQSLPQLAAACGVREVWYKDEGSNGGRWGLGSFKVLGGAYAVKKLHAAADDKKAFTVATATDGNHGRSVAWGAKRAGCRAVIFVHREVSRARVAAVEALGAQIIRIAGNYDDSVRDCQQTAAANGWQIVSDTSWAGYTEVPKLVMAGYTVLLQEAAEQLGGEVPTHLVLPAGVGTFAAAIAIAASRLWSPLPRIVIVESTHAACLLASARAGKRTGVRVQTETQMAGLSCGEPSLLAWEVLRHAASDFVAVADDGVAPAMRDFARGVYGGGAITAGECATAGVLALQASASANKDSSLASVFGSEAKVLLFGSEGATDREQYDKVISATA